MSMNMLPMQFDHKVPGPPTRLQELLVRVSASRRVRYGLSAALVTLFVIAVYALTGAQHFYHGDWRQGDNGTANEDGGGTITPPEWVGRAERVKSAFVRAYAAYEQHAFPHDELLPLSDGNYDEFNGWGVTLIDSLDTMQIMNLEDTLHRTMPHIANLTFDQDQNVHFFEAVIRYLGGLLSAYSLTGDLVYLSRADDLGQQLLPAFNTTQGLPAFKVNPKTGAKFRGWGGNNAILSEFASCQMEYRYLGHLTGRADYVRFSDHITRHLRDTTQPDGLFLTWYDFDTGKPNGDTYGVGARADSTYEYLLKMWLQTGKTEQWFLDMYLRAADAIITNLLYLSPTRKLLYASDVWAATLRPLGNFDHLTCFLGGLLALGAHTIPDIDSRHMWAAEGLTHACWVSYADSATGLGAEGMAFRGVKVGRRWVDVVEEWEKGGRIGGVPPGVRDAVPAKEGEDREYVVVDSKYMLRPETVESFYILWRTTGDPKWQERGWAVFEAIERHAAVRGAYATVEDVTQVPPTHKDEMPSFFLAETLKYLYLLFTEQNLLPLDKWTFNTEAHPLPVFTWSDWERELFALNVIGGS